MEEDIIYKSFVPYKICFFINPISSIFTLGSLPLIQSKANYLTITTQRVSFIKGIFSIVEEEQEYIRVKDISANTTIDWNDDVVVVDATAGDVTITPPTVFPVHASTKEKHSFYIIRKDSSTNKVIISSTTHPINGQIGSPASNQYLPFQYQSCKLLFNEDQWYVISSGVISGEYVPTITPGTNVTNVTLISAIYVATTEKANSNGIMVTVNLVLDVESTAAATLSDFVISAIRALPANVSGFGSIKSTSDVGPVYAEFQAVDQIKVSYVALSASPGVDRINLLYNCVVQ